MRRFILVNMAMLLLSGFGLVTKAQDDRWEDWQKHSWWCAHDQHSSGGRYRSMCTSHDQFESVIACQIDSGGSASGPVQQVQAAGRDAVNQFMVPYKPNYCQ
jgi:hypothetical protein